MLIVFVFHSRIAAKRRTVGTTSAGFAFVFIGYRDNNPNLISNRKYVAAAFVASKHFVVLSCPTTRMNYCNSNPG